MYMVPELAEEFPIDMSILFVVATNVLRGEMEVDR